MTKLKLFHVVERKIYHDIGFNEDTIAQTFSSYIQFDCEG